VVAGAAIAIAALGAGVAMAVNLGTAGELNYQRETYTIQGTNSQNYFTRRATCPASRHVTGGGFEAVNGNGEDPRPFDGGDAGTVPDDGWAVTLEIGSGTTGELTVYAICDD
jgi:hypothetical protein